MRVVRHEGARAFLDRAEAWLLEAEDRNNLILGLAYARAEREPGEDDLFTTVEEGGSVVGCAFRTPPHKLGLTEMPLAAVEPLVAAVAGCYEELPAVLGPADVAEPVAAAWAAATGVGWRTGMRQGVYRLDEVEPPRGVRGSLRPGTPDDLERARAWGDGFADDAGAGFRPDPAAIERWIERGGLYFWVDGDPVSMAVAQGRTPNGIRVGFVYTPPELRGRGYASACVAEVSRTMLATGLRFCVLYTDMGNPTSNAIYRRIGYRRLCEVVDCDFAPVP